MSDIRDQIFVTEAAINDYFHKNLWLTLYASFDGGAHAPSSKIKSGVLEYRKPDSELCVQWVIQNWRASFYLTALTEHQLQLTCFEKPKLPYPLRRYLLTQQCKPGVGVDD